jgi:hypothetical protein
MCTSDCFQQSWYVASVKGYSLLHLQGSIFDASCSPSHFSLWAPSATHQTLRLVTTALALLMSQNGNIWLQCPYFTVIGCHALEPWNVCTGSASTGIYMHLHTRNVAKLNRGSQKVPGILWHRRFAAPFSPYRLDRVLLCRFCRRSGSRSGRQGQWFLHRATHRLLCHQSRWIKRLIQCMFHFYEPVPFNTGASSSQFT